MDPRDQRFQLEVFEGPLDLLLFLIRKNEIDIHHIPIQVLTRQYLEYLELMKMLDLDIAAEFLSMAATLMHIKSRFLLPPEEREEEEEEDPRWDLVRRLLEYKRFKEVSRNLDSLQLRQEKMFVRKGEKVSIPAPAETLEEVGIFELLDAFSTVLKRASGREISELQPDPFTIEDGLKRVLDRTAAANGGIVFTTLFEPEETRFRIVVIFLAVLELIRRRVIRAVQETHFGRLRVYRVREEKGGS